MLFVMAAVFLVEKNICKYPPPKNAREFSHVLFPPMGDVDSSQSFKTKKQNKKRKERKKKMKRQNLGEKKRKE